MIELMLSDWGCIFKTICYHGFRIEIFIGKVFYDLHNFDYLLIELEFDDITILFLQSFFDFLLDRLRVISCLMMHNIEDDSIIFDQIFK